jgi:pyridoxine 5-phosphate synthase
LSVNLNKVALLRNQRDIDIPNVLEAARACIEAGAQGITLHPRPDERHTRYSDVIEMKAAIEVELNIEGNPFPRFMDLIRGVVPAQCTLVPDAPDQNTSDHGWDLARDRDFLVPLVKEMKDLGIRVSLFMDPVPEQMPLAKEIGADRVELYTEPYARAFREGRGEQEAEIYRRAADAATRAGLGLNAGHDLSLENLGFFLESVPGILEVSIGHALTAEALWHGWDLTIKKYLEILER